MTASEMMTFVYYLPLLIGDLVPEDDEVWQFLCNLISIIDILLLKSINASAINLLAIKIKTHHLDKIQLFNINLKPKDHLLTHYPNFIRRCGPPTLYWSIRFEGKHRECKRHSAAITSRENLPISLAKKFQVCSYDFVDRRSFTD